LRRRWFLSLVDMGLMADPAVGCFACAIGMLSAAKFEMGVRCENGGDMPR